MTAISERIDAMDEFQVVRFFQHFGQQLFAGTDVSLDQIRAGIPATEASAAPLALVLDLEEPQAEKSLEPSMSVVVARNTLLHLSEDERFGPLIETSLDSYRDDEMFAEVVLAVGFVASMILMVASTEFEGEIAGIKFHKKQADPGMIRAITEPFANVLGQLFKRQ